MALELYMLGLVVQDMSSSLEFYRRLGLAIPEGSAEHSHVEIKMEGGLTFFWDSVFVQTDDPGCAAPSGGYRIILECFLESRTAVDEKYAELIGFGYQGYRAPFETSFGAYFAMVNDPDGNTILFSA